MMDKGFSVRNILLSLGFKGAYDLTEVQAVIFCCILGISIKIVPDIIKQIQSKKD